LVPPEILCNFWISLLLAGVEAQPLLLRATGLMPGFYKFDRSKTGH